MPTVHHTDVRSSRLRIDGLLLEDAVSAFAWSSYDGWCDIHITVDTRDALARALQDSAWRNPGPLEVVGHVETDDAWYDLSFRGGETDGWRKVWCRGGATVRRSDPAAGRLRAAVREVLAR